MQKKMWRAAAVFALLLAALLPGRALAAGGYTGEYVSGGKVKVINDKTGATVTELSVNGMSVNTSIAASGGRIYFTACKSVGYETTNYLYYYNLSKKFTAYVRKLPAGLYSYDCNEVYGGYLYLSGWNPSGEVILYRCTTAGKNLKKIVGKAGYEKRYKQYIICDPTKTMGSFFPYNVYVYNAKTGKNKTAVKHIAFYSQSSQYIYAAVMPGEGYPGSGQKYKIVRYNMATGKTNTLVKSMKGYYISKINAKYVWYHTEGSYDDRTYVRYTIATGKRQTLTRAAFEKATGNRN